MSRSTTPADAEALRQRVAAKRPLSGRNKNDPGATLSPQTVREVYNWALETPSPPDPGVMLHSGPNPAVLRRRGRGIRPPWSDARRLRVLNDAEIAALLSGCRVGGDLRDTILLSPDCGPRAASWRRRAPARCALRRCMGNARGTRRTGGPLPSRRPLRCLCGMGRRRRPAGAIGARETKKGRNHDTRDVCRNPAGACLPLRALGVSGALEGAPCPLVGRPGKTDKGAGLCLWRASWRDPPCHRSVSCAAKPVVALPDSGRWPSPSPMHALLLQKHGRRAAPATPGTRKGKGKTQTAKGGARQQREEQKKARKCVTVYSSTSDREYEISPYCITCTCPDWEKKRRDAYGIFRCCKHLTFYYTMNEDDIPKSLRRLKSIFPSYGYADKGIPYAGKFAKAGVATDSTGETVYLATGDRFPWVTVYTDLTKGSFNVATGQWGRGKAPYGCRERIGEMLQKEARLSGFAPDDDEWKRPWLREAAAFLGRAPSQEEEAALRKHCGGDRECLYTLRMAAARLAKGERYCVVPRDNRYRSRFEALREGGGATTFTEAHPGLLEALTLAQLRAVGRAAGMEKLGRDKAASCRMLAELPPERLAGAWPASGVDVTDIFRIDLPARPE